MRGIINKLKPRGFGYITPSQALRQKELFFHGASLINVTFKELRVGDSVTFKTEESARKLNAIDVQRVAA